MQLGGCDSKFEVNIFFKFYKLLQMKDKVQSYHLI